MEILSLPGTPHAHLLPSPEEMSEFDAATIRGGVPARELMERAGAAVFAEIKERFSFELYSQGRITVLCGPGNNGGDGLVIARHLKIHGYDVVAVIASAARYSEDFLAQLAEYMNVQGAVGVFPEAPPGIDPPLETVPESDLAAGLARSTIIVDALLGTGQCDAPRGAIKQLIGALQVLRKENGEGPRIVAVDIPSGMNGATGEVYEPCVRADITIAIELAKRGMMQYPGRSECGEIWVVPIGIECSETRFKVSDGGTVKFPPPRDATVHKGKFGSVLVVGGSERMPGAPILTAHAALRTGSGIVRKVHLRGTALDGCPPEAMLVPIGGGEQWYTAPMARELAPMLTSTDALVIGPGIGTEPETAAFVLQLLQYAVEVNLPLVLDADGLNAIATVLVDKRGKLPDLSRAVLTPHPGEAGRLLNTNASAIQRDRYGSVAAISELTGAAVVLKGAYTVVADPKRGAVNTNGNPYLATPGSGDVLAGIVASLLGQRFPIFEAAVSGVYFHGRAGDMEQRAASGVMLAGDIIRRIPEAMRTIEESTA